MKRNEVLFVLVAAVVLASPVCLAGERESRETPDHEQMMVDQRGDMLLKKDVIDGYAVTFHVMRSTPSMQHGGSHNFMVKIEQGDKVLRDVPINSKVIRPDGASETRRLIPMGDWSMNGYDLGGGKRYELLILFMTPDGKKHRGGVVYEDVAPVEEKN